MKVLFAASEGVPFCKTGGLADVVGSLSRVIASKKHSVHVVLPFYKQIKQGPFKFKNLKKKISISFPGFVEKADLWSCDVAKNLTAIFIEADVYYDRNGLYGDPPSVDFPDNDVRFMFYSKAVFEAAKALDFKPDVIHCHDWQSGLVPAYLKKLYRHDPFFSGTASVFTIHNMAYQGNFSRASFDKTGLPGDVFSIPGAEFYGSISYLKAGLVYSDTVNTVSPTYAQEISSDSRLGCGMEGVLQSRRSRFSGITNGLDTIYWDPSKDKHLNPPFSAKSLKAREGVKAELQRSLGFKVDPKIPLMGFIGRLDPQKGIEHLIAIAPQLLNEDRQMIVLGVGSPYYVAALRALQAAHSKKMHVETDFSEPLAHRIYGGCDLFLMPSSYEPCGLGQMIAMRYGSIPVVTPTGGLLDTVQDVRSNPKGTGFVSKHVGVDSYRETLMAALGAFGKRAAWTGLQKRAMAADYSWKKSADGYLDLYATAQRWNHEEKT